MPAAAVTMAGWVSVSVGSTTASVGRRRGWLIPVLTCSDSTSRTQMVVLSLPVPVVVGTATSGSSALTGATRLADRRVDVVHQLAGVGQQQVDRLGGVDRGAAADRDDGVERAAVAGEVDRVRERLVGGLDVHLVVRRDVDAAVGDPGRDPLGVTGGGDPRVGDQEHPPGSGLDQVEADLVGGARPELQVRCAVGEHGLAHQPSQRLVSVSFPSNPAPGGGPDPRISSSMEGGRAWA